MSRVVVVGGGLAGLVAARDLVRGGADVTVVEAADRFGGKLWSSPVGDRIVDAGPDSFLVRRPEAVELADELGLTGEIVHPISPVGAYLWRDGALRPLPRRTFLGVPTDADALAESGAVSDEALDHVRSEPSRPAAPLEADVSVGQYCRDRLGDEITERLVDPLIGGVNAGHVDELSLEAGAPQLWAVARHGGSLVERLREHLASVGPGLGSAAPEAVFGSIDGGLHRIVEALVGELDEADLRTDWAAAAVDASGVIGPRGERLAADHVVVTTPASATAHLLARSSARAATVFAGIPTATASQVTLAFEPGQIDRELDASGVLFPRIDGGLMTACTWFSTKWPHYRRAVPGRERDILIRCTSGRHLDDRAEQLSDTELVEALTAELRRVVEWSGAPSAVRVHRWIDGFPQYRPGHLARLDLAERSLAETLPRVRLAGMALRGIGIPAVIASARDAAASILAE